VNSANFKPGTELNFNSVVAIREKLKKALKMESNSVFCLDLSEVTVCDSAGLALLIETKKLCKQYSKIFKVVGVSPKIQSLAEFCGVNDVLETA
jgi:phospholipid transport system transporter-binding protein